jgi:hypothetical protein
VKRNGANQEMGGSWLMNEPTNGSSKRFPTCGSNFNGASHQELDLKPKTVSNHLTALKAKNLVGSLSDGRWRFLPDPPF